jgi:hypothetical protein
MLYLLPMACASAIYPSLLAGVVLILGRPDPRRLLLAYLAGALTMSISAGLLVVFGLEASNATGGPNDIVGPGIDLAVGLVALLLFWVLFTDRDRRLRERRRSRTAGASSEDRDPWSRRILAGGSLRLTFLLGVALSLPGAMYLVALKDIAEADLRAAASVALVVAYNLIMFSLAEIPLVGYAVAPERTREMVGEANDWLGTHARQVAMWLCAAAGVVLVTRGLNEVLG